MSELTMADLKTMPSNYDSSRLQGEVLVGDDEARPLIEASSSGEDATLQSLLSQSQWVDIALQEPHTIYAEHRPSQGPGDVRRVSAMRISNLERSLRAAAEQGQAATTTTLLDFAKQQGVKPSVIINRFSIMNAIKGGNAGVFEAFAAADPNVINFQAGHGTKPLYEAVTQRQPEVVSALLQLGADPLRPVYQGDIPKGFRSSLLSRAAMSRSPRMVELLLQHGLPIAESAALHTAAAFGNLDTMRFLIQHYADVNEVLPQWAGWTPLHFAGSRGEVEAMRLLEQSGACSDVEDEDGKTAAQLLEKRQFKHD